MSNFQRANPPYKHNRTPNRRWELTGITRAPGRGLRTDQPADNAQYFNYNVYSSTEVMDEQLLVRSMNNLLDIVRDNNRRFYHGCFGYISFYCGDSSNCYRYGPIMSYSARERFFRPPIGGKAPRIPYLDFRVHTMSNQDDTTDLDNALAFLSDRDSFSYEYEDSAQTRINVVNNEYTRLDDINAINAFVEHGAPYNSSLLLAVAADRAWRNREGHMFVDSPFNTSRSLYQMIPFTGVVNGTPQFNSDDPYQVMAPSISDREYTRPNSHLLAALGLL